MADLNQVDNNYEEQDEQEEEDINKIDLSLDDIKKGKLKFEYMRDVVDYASDLKRILDLTFTKRKEERGKIHASLFGDPKDNKSMYKGKIGLLQRFFEDPYLHDTPGARNAELLIDNFKKIDMLSNEMIMFSMETINKLFFAMEQAIDMYQKHTDKLEREIELLRAKIEERQAQPEQPIEYKEEEPNGVDAKEIIDQYMMLYGNAYLDKYITEIQKPDRNVSSASGYKTSFIRMGKRYFSTYYKDAEGKARRLWDSLCATALRGKNSILPSEKKFTDENSSEIDKDVNAILKEGLNDDE